MKTPTTPSPSRFSADSLELKLEFTLVDRNRDGKVDYSEFKQMLEGLEAGMSESEMHIGFHEVDTDKDGFVSSQEFLDWWLAD